MLVHFLQQIFTYPTISSMSGVISPTNLSLFSSPVTVTRPVATQRTVSNIPPRWNTAPFINLEDDYNMIAPIIAGTTSEPPTAMDDGSLGIYRPLLLPLQRPAGSLFANGLSASLKIILLSVPRSRGVA